jgi:hypothetical protein
VEFPWCPSPWAVAICEHSVEPQGRDVRFGQKNEALVEPHAHIGRVSPTRLAGAFCVLAFGGRAEIDQNLCMALRESARAYWLTGHTHTSSRKKAAICGAWHIQKQGCRSRRRGARRVAIMSNG